MSLRSNWGMYLKVSILIIRKWFSKYYNLGMSAGFFHIISYRLSNLGILFPTNSWLLFCREMNAPTVSLGWTAFSMTSKALLWLNFSSAWSKTAYPFVLQYFVAAIYMFLTSLKLDWTIAIRSSVTLGIFLISLANNTCFQFLFYWKVKSPKADVSPYLSWSSKTIRHS